MGRNPQIDGLALNQFDWLAQQPAGYRQFVVFDRPCAKQSQMVGRMVPDEDCHLHRVIGRVMTTSNGCGVLHRIHHATHASRALEFMPIGTDIRDAAHRIPADHAADGDVPTRIPLAVLLNRSFPRSTSSPVTTTS